MKWIETDIRVAREFTEVVSILVNTIESRGLWIDESMSKNQVSIKSYVSSLEDLKAYQDRLRVELEALKIDFQLLSSEIDEASWEEEWKKYYYPTRVTDVITVKPIWCKYDASPDEKVIELDPGMSFGTGTHATTALMITLMEKHLQASSSILDIGCGSGILSIAAAILENHTVLAIDNDPVAICKTHENVRHNKVDKRVRVKRGNLVDGVEDTFDMVLGNLLLRLIIEMKDNLLPIIKPKGIFLCSGIVVGQEDDVIQALQGFRVKERACKESWVAIAFEKC